MKILYLILFLFFSISVSAEAPFNLPAKSDLQKIRGAIIYTEKGAIYLELYPQVAPWHVANFKFLSDRGFYNNKPFHIVETNYVIQTGALNSRPSSGPKYSLPPEFNRYQHEEGTVSMVRAPDDLDPSHERKSHPSQFRIMLKKSPHMDGAYTVFGKVLKGLDVAKNIRKGDMVKEVKVFINK